MFANRYKHVIYFILIIMWVCLAVLQIKVCLNGVLV